MGFIVFPAYMSVFSEGRDIIYPLLIASAPDSIGHIAIY